MFIDFLFDVFRQNAESEAVIWRDQSFAYGKLLNRTNQWRSYLRKNRIAAGTVTAVEADFSPNAIALMLALIETGCIAVPLTSSVAAKKAEFMAISGVEALLELDARDEARLTPFERPEAHEIVQRLRKRGHPGLVLFSSGSTGQSKATVHDIVGMLAKFKVRRHARRAITFLLYDHIGGFNTMLYQLSNAGCIVTVQGRDPDSVLRAVERHKVELLPTSPTFMNLILLSEAHHRYLRTVGSRYLAFEITLVGFTLGQAGGRRFSDSRGGRHPPNQGGICDARLSQRAKPVHRRRLV